MHRRNRFEGTVVGGDGLLRLLAVASGFFKNCAHKSRTVIGTCAHEGLPG